LFHFYQSSFIFASLRQNILFCPTCSYMCDQNNIIYLLSKIVKNNKITTCPQIIESTHLVYRLDVPLFNPFYSSLPRLYPSLNKIFKFSPVYSSLPQIFKFNRLYPTLAKIFTFTRMYPTLSKILQFRPVCPSLLKFNCNIQALLECTQVYPDILFYPILPEFTQNIQAKIFMYSLLSQFASCFSLLI
jgi:hypothetical protein